MKPFNELPQAIEAQKSVDQHTGLHDGDENSRGQLQNVVANSRANHDNAPHAMMSFTTVPCTSVNR